MKLEGRYEFDAPQSLVWEMLHDPDVLARTMPGCQKLDKVGDDTYKGRMKIKVGPVQGAFQGTVKLSDVEAPDRYRMQIHGSGPAGMIDGRGHVRLHEENQHTVLTYEGDANVSGRIASIGQRVMDSSARAVTQQSLENLDKQIQARLQPAADESIDEAEAKDSSVSDGSAQSARLASAPPKDEGPVANEAVYAFGIARELFNEFVPKEKQPLILATFGLIVCYLIFNLWTNIIARRVARQLRDGG